MMNAEDIDAAPVLTTGPLPEAPAAEAGRGRRPTSTETQGQPALRCLTRRRAGTPTATPQTFTAVALH